MQAPASDNQFAFRLEASLLWPPGAPQTAQSAVTLTPLSARDLGLDSIIANLGSAGARSTTVEKILLSPCREPEVIGYRQDVLEDLLGNPTLTKALQELMPILEALALNYYRGEVREALELYEVAWRLGELESIVACVEGLGQVFEAFEGQIRSEGLGNLRLAVRQITEDQLFQELSQKLPDWLRQVRSSQSVTIGVNLNPDLKPIEAVLLAVNDRRFTPGSLLDKLLDRSDERWRGIGPIHTSEPQVGGGLVGVPVPLVSPNKPNQMMAPLFRDLATVLDKVCKPISKGLKTYTHFVSQVFVGLWQDLAFYLSAVKLIKKMKACGLPMCRPQIAPADERLCQVEDSYNLSLALQQSFGHESIDLSQAIVTNDIVLGPQGRIQILTGPNLGGKTTYLQAVGLIQLLAQVGLHVPATRARISPADGIYSHFPVEEKLEKGSGRFGEEAQRLKEIFTQATRHSLILLNESLTSTSPGESLYLAQDLMRVMRMMGPRAIYATHMHELAAFAAEINQETEGDSDIVSMVASRIDETEPQDGGGSPGPVKRSYKVRPGPPMGRSFARELARRYGVSYEQLVSDLRERGLLPGTVAGDGPRDEFAS
jgi:DNA mismatch repair protein MutS